MTIEETPNRPIGWWLKEADARLEAAFDSALQAEGTDRRSWQVLATLASSPRPRAEVVASLTAFDEPAVLDRILGGTRRRGAGAEGAL